MIIGIVGFIGSGKSTVGDILVEDHGFRKMAFADSLKDAVSAIFGWPRHLLEGDTDLSREFRERQSYWWSQKLGYDVTPRLILQKFGTEVCREHFHNNIWVNSLRHKLVHSSHNDRIVITDVRFYNEIRMLHMIDAKVVRVVRGPNPTWYEDALVENTIGIDMMSGHNIHQSEWDWIGSPIDYTFDNNRTIDDLRKGVDWYIKNHYNNDLMKENQ